LALQIFICPPGDKMPVSFSILLDEETARFLQLLADSSDRSRSGLLRHLIRTAAANSPAISPDLKSVSSTENADGS
jgi:hypothetical protein